jgi:hypothetical protein
MIKHLLHSASLLFFLFVESLLLLAMLGNKNEVFVILAGIMFSVSAISYIVVEKSKNKPTNIVPNNTTPSAVTPEVTPSPTITVTPVSTEDTH